MRSIRLWTTMILAVVMLSAGACRSLDQITPAELDDDAIEAELRARIATEFPDKTFSIGISVRDRFVTLSGSVDSNEQRQTIADLARRIEGVRGVTNNLRVEP
jgi:osmotically-inducible protein OsmY